MSDLFTSFSKHVQALPRMEDFLLLPQRDLVFPDLSGHDAIALKALCVSLYTYFDTVPHIKDLSYEVRISPKQNAFFLEGGGVEWSDTLEYFKFHMDEMCLRLRNIPVETGPLKKYRITSRSGAFDTPQNFELTARSARHAAKLFSALKRIKTDPDDVFYRINEVSQIFDRADWI